MKALIKIGLFWLFACTYVHAQTGPQIQLEQETFDFGKINQGEIIRHTFKFKNIGDKDLLLTDVKTSCGCTASQWKRTATKPGDTGEIEVSFNSAGKMGPQRKSITITANTEPSIKIIYIVGDVFTPSPSTSK